MSISNKLSSIASSRRLSQAGNTTRTLEVTIGPTALITQYCEELAFEMSLELPPRYEVTEALATRLEQYVKLLIRMRGTQVHGKPLKFVRPGDEEILVPDFIHLLLSNIGIVEYKKRLIELKPKVDFITDEDQKLWDSFADVRRVLRRVEDKFPLARGLPREKEGNADFMVLQIVDGIVVGHEEGIDPVMPILGAFLEKTFVETVFKMDITYDHIDDVKNVIQYLVEPKGRGSLNKPKPLE